MHRFFVEVGLRLTPGDSRHVLRVLRMREGDHLVAVFPGGPEVVCRIAGSSGGVVRLEPLEERMPSSEARVGVTLFQGMPKGDKMDLIVEMTSEMGVSRVVPVACRRSVARPGTEAALRRVERWKRIAREAAALSGRLVVPEVAPIVDWEGALGMLDGSMLALVAWETGERRGLRETLLESYGGGGVAIFIGPEGGLEETEVLMARGKGAVPVSLGPRILRTETAAVTAVCLTLGTLGDLG